MDEEAAKKDAESAGIKPSGSKGLVTAFLIVNSVLLLAVLGVVLLRPHKGDSKKTDEAAQKETAPSQPAEGALGPTLRLADFLVHLRNPEADRYAKMAFELELSNEADKATITTSMPRVRDSIISYLSDRSLEELRGTEGLEKTKSDLVNRLSEVVPSIKVRAIYITDFVVQ